MNALIIARDICKGSMLVITMQVLDSHLDDGADDGNTQVPEPAMKRLP